MPGTNSSRLHIPLLFASVVGLTAVFGAARCPTNEPAGFGVLEFGAGVDARANEVDLALGMNPLFTWAELEPAEGSYNWKPLDDAIANAHSNGRKVAPRVYTNEGDFSQATPNWVFDAGAGAYVMDAESSTRQPLPGDGVFEAKFSAFLAALGARYDGHPAIEFVQTNAGMGAYGEMIWAYDGVTAPAGYSGQGQIDVTRHWIDRWRAAFPTTHLVLMQNFIGEGVAENVSAYAASRGFFLQSNTPSQEAAAAAILAANDDTTKIVLEIENRGCTDAEGAGFEALVDLVFSYGFAIDYLVVCGKSLDEAALQRAHDALRKN